jgi:uncharacterized caspase-like protein
MLRHAPSLRLICVVSIVAGLCALTMAASSAADLRPVKVEGKTPADYVVAQPGKVWAVVIGIDEYESLPPLKQAVAGAKALAGLLEQQGAQVASLFNKQATREAILGELGEKLLERVGDQDRVVIFLAGQGDTHKGAGGKDIGYFLPVDAKPDAPAKTGISLGLLRDMADALPAKQVLFLAEACYGGIPGQPAQGPQPMNESYLKQIVRERGRQMITGCGPNQQLTESPKGGQSAFVYFLLEGLGKGAADLNKDGIVPASELYAFLDQQMSALAKKKRVTQRPEMWALTAEKGEVVFTPGRKLGVQGGTATAAAGAGEAAGSDEVAKLRDRLEALKAQMSKTKPVEPASVGEAAARPFDTPRPLVDDFIEGQYWALIIGINTYPNMGKDKQLGVARNDAEAVAKLLVDRYGFASERVITFYDEQATRRDIIRAFSKLKDTVGDKDSLLIYYAGQGEYEPIPNERKEKGMGYWVPSDAESDDPSAYIFNSQIKDYLANIPARHIFVVADSSFSTSLIGRTIASTGKVVAKDLYQKKSRWVLSSGESFPRAGGADKNKQGHGVFAWHFLQILEKNTAPYLLVKDIIEPLAVKVSNDAQGQLPRSAPVIATGDDGGQFVFRLTPK